MPKIEAPYKKLFLVRPLIYIALALGSCIAISGWATRESSAPTVAPPSTIELSTPAVNDELDLVRDSPRPAAVSPASPDPDS